MFSTHSSLLSFLSISTNLLLEIQNVQIHVFKTHSFYYILYMYMYIYKSNTKSRYCVNQILTLYYFTGLSMTTNSFTNKPLLTLTLNVSYLYLNTMWPTILRKNKLRIPCHLWCLHYLWLKFEVPIHVHCTCTVSCSLWQKCIQIDHISKYKTQSKLPGSMDWARPYTCRYMSLIKIETPPTM